MLTAVQFSGGKDALACMYLYRDAPDTIAIYVDSGSTLSHVRDFVAQTAKDIGLPLHVVSPNTPCHEWQAEVGYPADIVPVDASPTMATMSSKKYAARVIPYVACCSRNIWTPMAQAIHDLKVDVVVRGSKACDPKVGVPHGHVENGVRYDSPLWAWTDDDVFAYLRSVGAAIPGHYADGCDSLDCWSCTAYMDHHGKARFRYLKAHYPDLHAEADRRLSAVRETLQSALDNFFPEA